MNKDRILYLYPNCLLGKATFIRKNTINNKPITIFKLSAIIYDQLPEYIIILS